MSYVMREIFPWIWFEMCYGERWTVEVNFTYFTMYQRGIISDGAQVSFWLVNWNCLHYALFWGRGVELGHRVVVPQIDITWVILRGFTSSAQFLSLVEEDPTHVYLLCLKCVAFFLPNVSGRKSGCLCLHLKWTLLRTVGAWVGALGQMTC